jgi:outer membrane protein assembly factor BamB
VRRWVRGSGRGWLVAAVAVAAAGCTSGGESALPISSGASEPSSTAASKAPATPPAAPADGVRLSAEAWHTTGITPVSAATAAGGRILVYGATGADLRLFALDARTGRVAWVRPAATSAVTPGIPWELKPIGDTVFYLRAAGAGLRATLVAADAATGRDRWVGAPAVFDQQPDACVEGETGAVCTLEHDGDGADSVLRGYRVRDGARASAPRLPAGARWIGPRLAELGGREPERLAGYDARGRQQWTRPLAQTFGTGTSTDFGWDFVRYGDLDAIAGGVGLIQPEPGGYPRSIPLDASVTGAVRASTGAKLWQVPHTAAYCNGTLDVPGTGDPDGPAVPVRCRYAGSLSFAGPDAPPVPHGAHATVEGFDVRTGRTTWTWDAGAGGGLVDYQHPPVRTGQTSVLLPDRAGRRYVVDLRTGATRPAAGTVGWCAVSGEFRLREPIVLDTEPITSRTAGTVYRACTPAGKDAVPTAAPADLVAAAGGVAAIAGPRGVVAYRTG